MNTIARLLMIVVLALPLAACKPGGDDKAATAKPQVALPTNDDANAWRDYISNAVGPHMEGVTSAPFVYLVPSESSPDFQGLYDRQLEKASGDVSRGIMKGNMLIYASPNSTRTADLVVAAFADVKPDKLKGVKLVFIGKAVDSDRVKAAVEASGVNYVFIEAK